MRIGVMFLKVFVALCIVANTVLDIVYCHLRKDESANDGSVSTTWQDHVAIVLSVLLLIVYIANNIRNPKALRYAPYGVAVFLACLLVGFVVKNTVFDVLSDDEGGTSHCINTGKLCSMARATLICAIFMPVGIMLEIIISLFVDNAEK